MLWTVTADNSGNITGTMGAGTQFISGLTVQSVPEPTSVALLGVAGLCALARRRWA